MNQQQTEAVEAAPPIQPLGDRVIVTPLTATERMSGGVIIPDVAQEKPQQGIVVAIGPKVGEGAKLPTHHPIRGDRVMYGKYAGSEITIEDVSYLVLREDDVMGILPPLEVSEVEADDEL